MEGDAVVFVLMILFWILSSVVSRFGRKVSPGDSLEDEASPASQRGATFKQALEDLAEQIRAEVEVGPAEPPVASEHRTTESEHRRTAPETRPTLSEHVGSLSEHRQTPAETRRTVSETVFDPSEHQWSMGEHVRGDVAVVRSAAADAPRRPVARSEFARRLQADLSGSSLARAMVLKEILGPPVSLRSPEKDSI